MKVLICGKKTWWLVDKTVLVFKSVELSTKKHKTMWKKYKVRGVR